MEVCRELIENFYAVIRKVESAYLLEYIAENWRTYEITDLKIGTSQPNWEKSVPISEANRLNDERKSIANKIALYFKPPLLLPFH